MLHKTAARILVLSVLLLMFANVVVAEGGDLTPEQVAAMEREFTYTTAEDVAAGRVAAERYWMRTHTIYQVAAAEREFSYTTAEAVQRGKAAADAYWQARNTATDR